MSHSLGLRGRFFRSLSITATVCVLVFSFTACSKAAETVSAKSFSIGVFVPGMVAGSPTYEMMVDGANKASADLKAQGREVSIKVVEAGYNQSEWQQSLMAMASESSYDLIVSSNPSIPELAVKVLESFPTASFLIMDAVLDGSSRIKTIGFDQYQQGFLNGRLAAQIWNPSKAHSVGLLAGQEYPVMNDEIKVGFLDGARSVSPDAVLEFRVLGNWYDPARAEELTQSMIDKGAQVILAIAGGGNQGVVNGARKSGIPVTWFDSPGFSFGADVIKGGTVVLQTEFCRKAIVDAAQGSLDYGKASIHGIADGAVDYAFGPDMEKSLDPGVYKALQDYVAGIKSQSIPAPRKP